MQTVAVVVRPGLAAARTLAVVHPGLAAASTAAVVRPGLAAASTVPAADTEPSAVETTAVLL